MVPQFVGPNSEHQNYTNTPWPTDHRQKIHKVPALLRQENNDSAYDPKVVSIGPYHYMKPDLDRCQSLKPHTLQIVVEGSNKSPEFLYANILEVVADARSCYYDGTTAHYSDQEFALMMLHDACFLICCCLRIGPKDKISWFMNCCLGGFDCSMVCRDAILLENQIPFQILILLLNLCYGEGEETVTKFMQISVWGQCNQQQMEEIQQLQEQCQPVSPFEAYRNILVSGYTTYERQDMTNNILLKDGSDVKKLYKSFRSAKDLKSKGIKFEPSNIQSLNKGIEFHSYAFYGILQVPSMLVSHLSKVLFLNMIAYELCPDTRVEHDVITYVSFMKSLINSPEDVKELRDKMILLTMLESDEEVARLFRDLNTYGMGCTNGLVKVKQRIQEHYDSKTKTWMAELMYIYFNNPWSVIAWLAALLLLVFTAIQTILTVKSIR